MLLGFLAFACFGLRQLVLFVTAPAGYQTLAGQKKWLAGELKALKAEYKRLLGERGLTDDQHGAASMRARLAARTGEDVDVIRKLFGGEKSPERLRAMYIERRDFVRRFMGENYLARPGEKDLAQRERQGD